VVCEGGLVAAASLAGLLLDNKGFGRLMRRQTVGPRPPMSDAAVDLDSLVEEAWQGAWDLETVRLPSNGCSGSGTGKNKGMRCSGIAAA
jgi:hypothetical protein